MPVDNWPSTLPQKFLRRAFNETMGDGLLRSTMDTGPAKVRRRSSNAPRLLEVTAMMTGEQIIIARNFIDQTLLGGSLPFQIRDPLAGPISGYRSTVRLTKMPSWTALSDVLYEMSLSLEVLFQVAPPAPTFDTTAMTPAREAVAYEWRPTVIEGTRPFQAFAITAGSLPPGMTLDTATGTISGATPDFGTFTFTLRVTDADGRTASVSRTLVVRPPGFIFADGEILDPTFTRASGATYWGRDGVMRVAGTNVPRFDYDPVSGAFRGVLMEESRTNICLNFQAFNTTRATMTSIANDRGLNLFRFTPDTSAASSHQSIYSASFAALTADTLAAISVIVKQDGPSTSRIALRLADTVGFLVYMYFDIATGTFINTPSSSVVASYTATNLGGGYWELKLVYVIRSTSTYATLQLYAASPDSVAVTTYNFNGTDAYIVAHPQIEIGTFPTSYIPTTTAAATRAADAIVISGGWAQEWFNATEGSCVVQFSLFDPSGSSRLIDRSSGNNGFFMALNANPTGRAAGQIPGGGGNVTYFGSDSVGRGSVAKFAYAYSSIDAAISVDGLTPRVESRASPVPAGRSGDVRVGWTSIGNGFLNGHMRSLKYFSRRVSDEELQELTAA